MSQPPKSPPWEQPAAGTAKPAPAAAPRKQDLEILMEDLAQGAEYQKSVLPSAAPDVPGYELGFLYRAARTISGDFYDFVSRPDGRLGLMIADASGKGIPAALATMTCRAMLRAQETPGGTPTQILANVNRMIHGAIKRGMFISGAYGVLDPAAHTLTVANAGHLPTVLWKSRHKIAMTYPSKGPVLGVLPPAAYAAAMKEDVLALDPGDRFLLFTDGVNEAMAPGQKEFGVELLRKRLQAESDGKSSELLRRIGDQIEIHRGGGDQSDDITIVTGRRLP